MKCGIELSGEKKCLLYSRHSTKVLFMALKCFILFPAEANL